MGNSKFLREACSASVIHILGGPVQLTGGGAIGKAKVPPTVVVDSKNAASCAVPHH